MYTNSSFSENVFATLNIYERDIATLRKLVYYQTFSGFSDLQNLMYFITSLTLF